MLSSKLCIFGLVLIAVYLTGTQADGETYTIKKPKFDDPACKKLMAYMVRLEKKGLNLSGYSRNLEVLAKKYPETERKKRDNTGLGAAMRSLTGGDGLSTFLDHAGAFMDVALPCVPVLMRYTRFWVHEVTVPIFKDQIKEFMAM